jgi:hypothetical protein
VKTDRFSSASAWAAAVLLVVLVFTAGRPGAGQSATEAPSKRLADELAKQAEAARTTFAAKRLALHTVPGKSGVRNYLLNEVFDLISSTRRDLDQAIAQVGEPGLQGLRFWAATELKGVQNALPASAAITFSRLATPRAVAVIASREWVSLPRFTSGSAAPRPDTISAEKANGLLDKVGAVIERIFVLASHDDLEVKVWIGSTPAPKAQFSFWPMGEMKGSPAPPIIVRTDDWSQPVFRGVFRFRAVLPLKKGMDQVIEYPGPAGASTAAPTAAPTAIPSERLDLVNGSGFFCCRFEEGYCHDVEDETKCRP